MIAEVLSEGELYKPLVAGSNPAVVTFLFIGSRD